MRTFQEADAVDDEGRVLVSPGLKVRHVDSQFEYTVGDVIQDDEGIKVVLQLPEEPRFEPSEEEPAVLGADQPEKKHKKVMYEVDPSTFYFEPEEESDADTITVTQQEFEDEYEVK